MRSSNSPVLCLLLDVDSRFYPEKPEAHQSAIYRSNLLGQIAFLRPFLVTLWIS